MAPRVALVYSSIQVQNVWRPPLDSEHKHWVSVAAAISNGERVLAVRRRDNNKWEPPGGTLEPDETILDGLQREVLEEVGVTIREPRLTGVYKNMSKGIVALVFRCDYDKGSQPGQSDEVAEVRWMSQSEILEHLDEAYAYRLLDALTDGEPAIRAHDGVNLTSEPGTYERG